MRTVTSDPMTSFSVEQKIAEAIENGEFDDLPGQGEPLSLDALARDENLAHRLLVKNGFALPWIEIRIQMDEDWARATKRLSQRLEWIESRGKPGEGSPSWASAVKTFRQEIEELNQRMDDYNLSVPLALFQRRRLDAEAEIERVISG